MAALPPSPLIHEALATATEAHAGQIRNGAGGIPYIEHPKAVAELLAEHGWTEAVLAAALLHDVVEDSETSVAELRERFGEPVAGLVVALSDDESIADWRQRKAEHRARVQGEAVAAEFKVPLEWKLEAWESDLGMLRERAPELPFLNELASELELMRSDRAREARDQPRRR